MTEFHSPNFAFLADLDPPLMHQAALAECYCNDDPSSSLTKLRLFGELLAKNIGARFGIYTDSQYQQHEILKELKFRDILDQTLADTRKLIDQQLLAAGWEADTAEIRYSKGIRPEKGKNKAIAEWPTHRGPSDYVLFLNL
jgi:type I restriction enzyme R subunit